MQRRNPLRERIEAAHVIERVGWRVERVRSVTDRLQAALGAHERFETLVIHAAQANAFTGPGRTIYITHSLIDQLPDEAATAFVIAHELAHHHLGHVPGRFGRAAAMFDDPPPSHELENHADLHAIELCLAAGYEPERCLLALRVLDAMYLHCGELEAALGVPHDREGDAARRGYFSTQDRIAHVGAHVAAYRAGTRIVNVLAAERDAVTRRRMKAALATFGSLAAAAALVLLRRR